MPSAPTAAPVPRAKFVKDVTVQDGTAVAPGTRFTKVWRLKNTDPKSAWPTGTRITNVGGCRFSIPEQGVIVPAAGAGEEIDIKLEMVAPRKEGRIIGYFRLISPGGIKFGHRIWLDVRVDPNLPAPPQPALPAPAQSSPYELQLQLLQGMGFADTAQCEAVLEAEGGDLQRAVEHLLK